MMFHERQRKEELGKLILVSNSSQFPIRSKENTSHPPQHQHGEVIGGGHILYEVQEGFLNYVQQIRSGVAFVGSDGVDEACVRRRIHQPC